MEQKVRKFEQRREDELLVSTTLIYIWRWRKTSSLNNYFTILFEFLEQRFSTF
jgi:hypothetical protein